MADGIQRAQLFRFLGWFAMANAVVLGFIGIRYFWGFSTGGTPLSWAYLLLIYPAHHVLQSLLPLFILLSPLVAFAPGLKRVAACAVLIYAVMIAVIVLDSLLWSDSRFHLNALTMQILGWQSWTFAAIIFFIALVFESLLAHRTWLWVMGRSRRGGRLLAGLSVVAVIVSQSIYAWADATYYVSVTSVGQQLPVYKGFTAKKQLAALGLVNPTRSREREMAKRISRGMKGAADHVLHYPLNPLQCSGFAQRRPHNLILILADAMRSDVLNERVTPRLWQRTAARGQRFAQHYSGGNASRIGVFSLFYGLPPGYWSSFESLQRSSLLIDEMQRQNYRMGIFSSSTLYRPIMLDRTAFANVPDLRLETGPADAPSWQKDSILTDEWVAWLDANALGAGSSAEAQPPFFEFLFYNATNALDYPPDMDFPAGFEAEYDDPLAARYSEYLKSAFYIDGLIERVMADLDSRGLLESTVVVLTSDHGEEFEETEAGLSGHGSGYTPYQLQVPMVLFWPGKPAQVFTHRSSHYDVVPTLMKELLGCSNEPSDFALGSNLFAAQNWDWLLVGSYYNYAVLEPDQVLVTYPNGSFAVRDSNYRIATEPRIRPELLEAVSRDNSRFYR